MDNYTARYTKEEQQFILLGTANGMTAPKLNYLLSLYQTPEAVWSKIGQDNPAVSFLGEELINHLLHIKNNEYAKEYFQTLKKQNIHALCPVSPYYPQKLRTLDDAPSVLFVKGDPAVLNQTTVSVIGSRKCTRSGREIAHEFAKELARHGVAVVSGMAKGIDSEAHLGALEAENGKTIAVLGNGLDICYPAENRTLFQKIPTRGALVTEFPLGARPYPGNFPRRNRIISGLSDILLVVEAGLRSGALITVETAVSQGREVRCIPGDIHSPNSFGVNSLIRDGAKAVLSPEDILSELGISYLTNEIKKPTGMQLSGMEKRIFELLFDSEKSADELSALLGTDVADLNSVLTMLELRDIVKQSPGRIFSIKQ